MARGANKDNPVIIQLGAYIRKLRIEKGYTSYEHFAWDNEMSRTQIGRYEKGEDMRFTSLLKLSEALGLPASELLAGFEQELEKAKKKKAPKKAPAKKRSTGS